MGPQPLIPSELTRGPFDLAKARRAGLTRWHLASRAWRPLGGGIYAWSGIPDTPRLRLQAVLVRQPAAVFTQATAAWLHGLDVPPCDPITYSLDPADTVEVQGFRATSRVRTLFDVARRLPPVEAVPLIDVAVRRRLVTLEALRSYWLQRAGGRHVKRARKTLELADPAAESPMESRLRVVLVLAGLPRPLLQVPIRNSSGKVLGRADLYYPSHRLVIEYDGGTHRESLVEDNRRQNAILSLGCQILRFTAPDVLRTPASTARQVRAILDQQPLPHLAASREFTAAALPRLANSR